MAISVLRLRRSAVSLSSFIINHHRTSISSSIPSQIVQSSSEKPSSGVVPNFVAQFRAFRSSNISLARPRTYDNDEDMKIGPDDILFEGCDYNHWLITMDFPKDPKPSPEEMVETYVQTAAKVLGSVEEAKKAIYACSTTTYQGFQVQVSEDVSKKFEGLPGVVFILPDSYIDPVNKQYGGDKYENGIITHRPPPIQYGRQGGRFGDRNRDFNRQQSRPQGEYQQGNRAFDNRGQVNSGNFGPRQNPPPQQNYGPPRDAPVNYPAREQENHQGYRRDQMPPNQGNYNQGQRGNFYPQQQRVPPQEPNNHAPPQGGNFRQGGGANYGPGAGSTYGQPPAGGTYGQPPAGGTYGQPPAGGTYGQPPAGGTYRQPPAGGTYGQPPAGGTYGQPPAGGNYGQVPAGNYGQGVGSYGHGTSGYGQGAGSNYGQGASGSFVQGAGGSSSVHGEDQRFSQGEQMNDLQQVQR